MRSALLLAASSFFVASASSLFLHLTSLSASSAFCTAATRESSTSSCRPSFLAASTVCRVLFLPRGSLYRLGSVKGCSSLSVALKNLPSIVCLCLPLLCSVCSLATRASFCTSALASSLAASASAVSCSSFSLVAKREALWRPSAHLFSTSSL